MKPARTLLVTLALGLASAAGWASDNASAAPQDNSASALFSAPLVDLKDLPATLALYRGKPLIVNFWARWCGPCKVEIPELISLAKSDKVIQVIGLNIESNTSAVREFAYAYDMHYPVFLTRESGTALMQALGNPKMMLPFTLAISAKGEVVQTHLGVLTRSKLDQMAAKAVQPDAPGTATP